MVKDLAKSIIFHVMELRLVFLAVNSRGFAPHAGVMCYNGKCSFFSHFQCL